MPLLDIRQTRKVTAICSLEESTALQVDQYAAFVKCLPDEVVNKALEYTFGKDSEFQKFRTSTPKVPAQLRIKKQVKVQSGARRGPKQIGSVAAD